MKQLFLAVLVLATLVYTGCATGSYQAIKVEEYPSLKKSFDVSVGWKTQITASGLRVVGYLRNNRYPSMDDLILMVELVDRNGSVRARDTFMVVPTSLRQGDLAEFSLMLPQHPQAGDRLRFNYRYVADEGQDNKFSWMNSFEVPALDRSAL